MHFLKAIATLFFQPGQFSTSRVVGKRKLFGRVAFPDYRQFYATWQVESGSKIVVLRGLEYREGFTSGGNIALESSPRSVFALTPWRLVCGYPNERKPAHKSTCGACDSAAAFVLPSVLSFSLLPVRVAGGLHRSTYLPTYLLCYLRLAGRSHFPGRGRGSFLKGLAQFSTATPDAPKPLNDS